MDQRMCHNIKINEYERKKILTCPQNCIVKKLTKKTFEVQDNGTLVLTTDWKNQTFIQDYCTYYECNHDIKHWNTAIDACLCLKNEGLVHLDKSFDQNVSRCCANTSALAIDVGNQVFCSDDEKNPSYECSTGNVKNQPLLNFTSGATLNENHEYICLGYTMNKGNDGGFIQPKLFYCPMVNCVIGQPCIR